MEKFISNTITINIRILKVKGNELKYDIFILKA